MSDGIVPALRFGCAPTGQPVVESSVAPANGVLTAPGSVLAPRSLDLRRTAAPRLGAMPPKQPKGRQPRRYAVVLLGSDGRFTDQQLFSQLGWTPGTRVDIGLGDGHEIVVRRDEQGDSTLTSRNMVLVPASLRHWCGYETSAPVLVVAVPSMSAVVLHTLETLDQALPDPRRIVERMRPAGAPPDYASSTSAPAAGDSGDGEHRTELGAQHGDVTEDALGLGDGRG